MIDENRMTEKLAALEQGATVEFDPDEAEALGAFEEDALSEEDAQESLADYHNSEDRNDG